MSQAEIEKELRWHGSGFAGGKQRIMALYQTQPDRKLRAKALAKEYGIGGHSTIFWTAAAAFVNHDWKGLEFDHYPDHQKITLKWAQVEQYIDLMIQSDRYLTDKEKEHYTPPAPVSVKPDGALTRAQNLILGFVRKNTIPSQTFLTCPRSALPTPTPPMRRFPFKLMWIWWDTVWSGIWARC